MKMKTLFFSVVALVFCTVSAQAADFQISSPAFGFGHAIPQKYTCSGANVSPALFWKGAPKKTKSFVLIVQDPDAPAGVWTHWVIYNIPASAYGLSAHVSEKARLRNGSVQGVNSFGGTGYGGPCPPYGHASHRYYFRLYALDKVFPRVTDATVEAINAAMKGHVLATASLMGRYERGGMKKK